MTGWGPQRTGGVSVTRRKRPGGHWLVYAVASVVFPFLALVSVIISSSNSARCRGSGEYRICTAADTSVNPGLVMLAALTVLTVVIGFALGLADGRSNRKFAQGRTGAAVFVLFTAAPSLAAYAAGFWIGGPRLGRRKKNLLSSVSSLPPTHKNTIVMALDPYRALVSVSSGGYGRPGGHVGWTNIGEYISANPRGGMLVIGPPGSGKSSAVIIPSVIVAPGATVSASIKDDVMQATASIRAHIGRVWHFDPGGAENPAPGVLSARWSPLVSIRTWDDARIIANRLAEPAMKQGKEGGAGGDDHFAERARDWLEVLLYAAVLDNHPISQVAEWAQNPDSEQSEQEVNGALIFASQNGDQGAHIAKGQLKGLLDTPDRERGSIKSTLNRLLRIYGSVAARQIGDSPNFNPAEFVRSSDTLYITASPERQKEYAPLIAGLLEEIRFATYARHKAQEAGTEPKRHHVTFVLDEANNTAPIPLPAIISEAGGQSLHIIVGIQDLSRARERWGRAAEGFLTLFPTKLVLNGVVEPYTLDALSNASGEYDRVMMGYSESTSYVGQYNIPIRQQNPNYSVTRQKVLHQGDIARLPSGKALLFEGAQWSLVNLGMHWQDPVWQRVDAWAAYCHQQNYAAASIAPTKNADLDPIMDEFFGPLSTLDPAPKPSSSNQEPG